jgi:hypothetical protein
LGEIRQGEGSGLNVAQERRRWRKSDRASDRAIVLPRLGNASGGKGPDFWCAFEEAEDG